LDLVLVEGDSFSDMNHESLSVLLTDNQGQFTCRILEGEVLKTPGVSPWCGGDRQVERALFPDAARKLTIVGRVVRRGAYSLKDGCPAPNRD
jgi:hypothetical protein